MIPPECRYTETHEWVKIEGALAIVGITDHAQKALGDITYLELPALEIKVVKGGECGMVESVKAASDIYSPLSGEVAEVNKALEQTPEKVNQSPYQEGWMFKLKNFDRRELDQLMDAAAYQTFLETHE